MSEYVGWLAGFFAFADPPARFLVTFAGAAGAVAASDILDLSSCFANKELEIVENTPPKHTTDTIEWDTESPARAYKRIARTSLRHCFEATAISREWRSLCAVFVFVRFSFVAPHATFPQWNRSKPIARCKGGFSPLLACVLSVNKPQVVFLQPSKRTTDYLFANKLAALRLIFFKFLQFC